MQFFCNKPHRSTDSSWHIHTNTDQAAEFGSGHNRDRSEKVKGQSYSEIKSRHMQMRMSVELFYHQVLDGRLLQKLLRRLQLIPI